MSSVVVNLGDYVRQGVWFAARICLITCRVCFANAAVAVRTTGQVIGRMGNSGYTTGGTGVHLHYNWRPLNWQPGAQGRAIDACSGATLYNDVYNVTPYTTKGVSPCPHTVPQNLQSFTFRVDRSVLGDEFPEAFDCYSMTHKRFGTCMATCGAGNLTEDERCPEVRYCPFEVCSIGSLRLALSMTYIFYCCSSACDVRCVVCCVLCGVRRVAMRVVTWREEVLLQSHWIRAAAGASAHPRSSTVVLCAARLLHNLGVWRHEWLLWSLQTCGDVCRGRSHRAVLSGLRRRRPRRRHRVLHTDSAVRRWQCVQWPLPRHRLLRQSHATNSVPGRGDARQSLPGLLFDQVL